MKRALLFDLDGTLVDTAPDMVRALDLLLAEHQRPPVNYAFGRAHVSRGAAGLVSAGFPDITDDTQHERLRQRYLEVYADNLCDSSALFPGLDAVLQALEALPDLTWGIVTNKPAWLAEPLLDALALRSRSACLVCGDTLPRRKPHPDPLLHACRLTGVAPEACAYVGDDRRDITASRAAAMPAIAAGWGYIGPGERPDEWRADFIAATPTALHDWLRRHQWLDADNA